MTVLSIDKPITQAKPVLLVENKLALGPHRFSLVVVNDRGIESAPATLVVTVRKPMAIGPTGITGRQGRGHDVKKGTP